MPTSYTSSPAHIGANLPSPHPSPLVAPRFPPGLTPSGALAIVPPTPSSASSSNSSGSGRGRRLGSHKREGSVQSRRTQTSLGLGAEFASLNELASPASSSSRGSTSQSPSPQRATSPPVSSSRRGSLQFAPAPSSSHSSNPPMSPALPPGLGPFSTPLSSVTEGVATTSTPINQSGAPSRRPSLTHLASFLSGITHHTRVRSPGVHGGRGVSRSASRSQSRAGARRYGSGGESDVGGGNGSGGEGESDAEGSEYSLSGGFAGGGPPGSLSRANSRRRRTTTGGSSLSRASSVRSGRSRASSVSSSIGPHPLLHELVRENMTGGDIPSTPSSPQPPSLHSPLSAAARGEGPNVVAGTSGAASAGTVQPEVWEQTYEAYKPSTVTISKAFVPDEEPFLDSAPNSPEMRMMSGDADQESEEEEGEEDGRIMRRRVGTYSTLARTSSALSSVTNDLSTVDVFSEGERVGVGVWLEDRGGWVRDCFAQGDEEGMEGKGPGNGLEGPRQLEVERRLGEGTYAIVYLVREVLYDPSPLDDDFLSPIDPVASFSFSDSPPSSPSSATAHSKPPLRSWDSDFYGTPQTGTTYGEYFALKCLCKKNLTDELIEVQRAEAYLHRRLPRHENVVQMYGAYETDDWLFLVLEYAGGRDAFYWLLEAQEHGTEDLYSRATSPSGDYLSSPRRTSFPFSSSSSMDDDDPDDSALSRTITADTPAHLLGSLSKASRFHGRDMLVGSVEETPPSPSLLSAAVGDALLSRKRLRLISRMFGQMCSAVQACHDVGISHRDIKPENFIVIDGKGDLRQGMDGEGEKKRREGVVVKITDWGLGTMQDECEDFDCGSKPYMAYECRNNLRPTYDPRQADVWSLGLVFLNLLYHRNPWADPSLEDPDFADYVDDPIGFLQTRFEGMSDEVATFLAERVFCDVLEFVDGKQRRRISAGEFGQWASRLVIMLGQGSSPFSPGFGNSGQNGFSLHGNSRPPFAHLDSSNADYDFSPVATMPLTIPGAQPSPTPGAANVPSSGSLLSQHFAPSTLRASSVFPPDDGDLPTVPEMPSRTPSDRPAFITSPTALSEDGDSLPSPTFPSPPPPPSLGVNGQATSPQSIYSPLPSAHASPEQKVYQRMPWSSPLPSPKPSPAVSPASKPADLPSTPLAPPFGLAPPSSIPTSPSQSPRSPPPAQSGLSLLAARRPSLLDPQADSTVTVIPPSASPPPPPPVPAPQEEEKVESEEGSPDPGTSKDAQADAEAKKAHKSKRRKRGARKEKKAAKLANGGASSPPPPPGGIAESKPRDVVLDDLAAASQELARELSTAKSNGSSSSSRPTRPRPVPSSRSHGTQSTSALPFTLSSPDAFPPLSALPPSPKKSSSSAANGKTSGGGGMFGRLRTLVNEGNSDLEAFKRKVEEKNQSIGAISAPAKMQGAKVPKGKFDSPFSSRGSGGGGGGGTASWGSAADGGDEAVAAAAKSKEGRDHWSSASTRRDRLAGRREDKKHSSHGAAASEFAPSSSSTRAGGGAGLSAFDSSRGGTPLSSFGSVNSSDWRSNSHSRGRPELSPPLPLPASPPQQQRPKLKDASTDTSDLQVPSVASLASTTTSPTSASGVFAALSLSSSRQAPTSAVASAPAASPSLAKASPRPLAATVVPSASSPVLSPASAAATLPGASGTPGKNRLSKMLGSISVFSNRAEAGGAK
ncbi:hypothetical protein JCM11641_002328 [Rhodosporidiobolus odoratus]